MRRRVVLSIAFVLSTLLSPAALLAQQPLSTADAHRANQHYLNGWDFLRVEAFEDAVQEFRKVIEIDNRYAHAYYGLGKAHMGLKQYVQAVQAYERCRSLYEQATSDRTNAQYEANDQRREQILKLRDVLRSYQQMPANQQASSRIALAMTELQEQIRQLESANQRGVLVDPAMRIPAFVSLALGSAYFRNNRMEDAERLYREAINAKPDYGEAHNNLAVICMLSGRLDDAEKHVKLAEKGKFKVHPQLKDEIKARKKGT